MPFPFDFPFNFDAEAANPSVRATTSGSVSTNATYNVTKPTGTADNDILIVMLTAALLGGSNPLLTPPTGWETFVEWWDTTGSDMAYFLCWKKASSEGSSWDFTFDRACSGEKVCVAVKDADYTSRNPFDCSVNGMSASSGTSVVVPSITTVTNNALVLLLFNNDATGSHSASGLSTEELDVNFMAVYSELITSAGAIGDTTVTMPSGQGIGCHVAIRSNQATKPTGAKLVSGNKAGNHASGNTSVTCAFPSNLTAGSLIVVAIEEWHNVTPADPPVLGDISQSSGTAGLTGWQLDDNDSYNFSGNDYVVSAIYSATVGTGGSCTIQLANRPSGAFINIGVAEFSGVDTSSSRVRTTITVKTGLCADMGTTTTNTFNATEGDLIVAGMSVAWSSEYDFYHDDDWYPFFEMPQGSTENFSSVLYRFTPAGAGLEGDLATWDSWQGPAASCISNGVVYKVSSASGSQYSKTAAVTLAMAISDSENANFLDTAAVGLGMAIGSSEKANFPETSAVGIGMNIADSEKANFPETSAVGINLAFPQAIPQFFGCTTQDGNYGASNNGYCFGNDYETDYVCPGTGPQTVTELSAYLGASGAGGNARMALYTTAGALVCQHNAKFAVSTTAGWQGGATPLSGNTTIIGGNAYKILMNIEGSQPIPYTQSGTSDGSRYQSPFTYYTDGFPASIPTLGNTMYNGYFSMRCGITGSSVSETADFRRTAPVGIGFSFSQETAPLLIAEGFEGTANNGYENAGWVETVGSGCSINPNCSTTEVSTPANWNSDCLKIVSASGVQNYIAGVFNDRAVTYYRFEFVQTAENYSNDTGKMIALITNQGGVTGCVSVLTYQNSSGDLYVVVGFYLNGVDPTYSWHGPINLNTKYRVEIKWDKTNNKAQAKVNGIAGTEYDITTGSVQAGLLALGDVFAAAQTSTVYYDRVAIALDTWIPEAVTLCRVSENAIFIRSASAGIGLAITSLGSKGANVFVKTASVSMNFQISNSEVASFLESLGVGIGMAISDQEKADFKRTGSVTINTAPTSSEVASFIEALNVGIGMAITDSEKANFIESLAVGIGMAISDSEKANFPETSAVGVNIAPTDSEKADFNRSANVNMGMAINEQEIGTFPETNSVTILITSQTTGQTGAIRLVGVTASMAPTVSEIANFLRQLLPNISVQVVASEKADFRRALNVGIGAQATAAEIANFVEQVAGNVAISPTVAGIKGLASKLASVGIGMNILLSKTAALVRGLAGTENIQVAVSEISNFVRGLGVGIQIATMVSEKASFPELASVATNIRPQAFKSVPGQNAVLAAVYLSLHPEVVSWHEHALSIIPFRMDKFKVLFLLEKEAQFDFIKMKGQFKFEEESTKFKFRKKDKFTIH